MKQSGWSFLLFREEATVSVAVHEDKYGRKLFLSRPFQAPEKMISTAEYPRSGKRIQIETYSKEEKPISTAE